jgi:acetylornithine deacetylase/succinyl-diaminopimelate desuccinylase-like protein
VPPLTPQIIGPVQKLAAEYFPGVPVVPVLQAGATDGAFFNAIGIPTYGIMPVFIGPDLGHVHGLNEYVSVESLLIGRDFLHELIQVYASQK